VAVVSVLPALPAAADAVDSAVNSSRATSLPNRSELEQVANASAARQAAAGAISHASLSPVTGICSSAGEIVGAGPSVQTVFDLFLKSSTHRQLLLSPAWTAMGTGAATGSDGKIYIAVVFCTEINPTSGSAPAPNPPPPATSPTPPAGSSSTPSTSPIAASVPAPPAAPTLAAFSDVFFRLFTGELTDLWQVATVVASSNAPDLAPAPFLSIADWTVPAEPALS
jgi:hypothetical protein